MILLAYKRLTGGVDRLLAGIVCLLEFTIAIASPPAAAQQVSPRDLRLYMADRTLLIKFECSTIIDAIDAVDAGTIPAPSRVGWASGALVTRAGRVITALHPLSDLLKADAKTTASGKRYNVRCDGSTINITFYRASSDGLNRAASGAGGLPEIRSQRQTEEWKSIDLMVLHADTKGADDLPFFCPPASPLRRPNYENLEINVGGIAGLPGGGQELRFRKGRGTADLGTGDASSFLKFEDAPTERGMSGGPIVDAAGRLVGLIHGREDRFEERAAYDLMIPAFLLDSVFSRFGDVCPAPGRIVGEGTIPDITPQNSGNVTVTIPIARAEGEISVGKLISGVSFRGAAAGQAASDAKRLGERVALQLRGGEGNQCDDQSGRTGSSASLTAFVMNGEGPGTLRLGASMRAHGGHFRNAVGGCAGPFHLGVQGNDTRAEATTRYTAQFSIAVPEGGQKLRLEWSDVPSFEYQFMTPTDATDWIKHEGTGVELLQLTHPGLHRVFVRSSVGCAAEGGSGTCDRDFDGRLALTVAEPGEIRSKR